MKLLGKYLKEKSTANGTQFYWYRLSFFDIIAVFVSIMLWIYLLGFYLNLDEIIGLKILKLNGVAQVVLIGANIFLAIFLLFNRKSVLSIEKDQISFKKRPITSAKRNFKMDEIQTISKNEQSKFYENDVGYYPDIYTLKIHLKNGKKIRLGGFNEEDCNRLKSKLNSQK
ncbi:MAG: hypothetical protein KDC84_04710 [Crocinitomicaceae bacterium]|nr:hypothetical protein [Crocinitomicaceae bacterium]